MNEKMNRDHKDRQNIILWRKPLITLLLFFFRNPINHEVIRPQNYGLIKGLFCLFTVPAMFIAANYIERAHQQMYNIYTNRVLFTYQIDLGIVFSFKLETIL